MKKKHLYFVTGGLGKNIIFTSILDQLYEKHKDKICIEASYPKVFYNNPFVASAFPFTVNPILNVGSQEHYMQYEEIHGADPYYFNFLKKEEHIITSYQKLNNLEIVDKLPNVYWDIQLEKKLQQTIKEISPFILLQFSGGPTNASYDANNIRDYNQGQLLVNKIKQKFPNLNLLVFGYDHSSYDNALKINFQLTEQYFILAKYCLTFISIDSALQHFASSTYLNKKGIALWGETFPHIFGYNKNINLLSSTPHVVDIDPDKILDNLTQLLKNC